MPQEAPESAKSGSGEPLEVHGRRGQECLDAHVPQPAPDSAGKPVPGLRLAAEALETPVLTLVPTLILRRPSLATASGPQ